MIGERTLFIELTTFSKPVFVADILQVLCMFGDIDMASIHHSMESTTNVPC